MRLSMVCPRIGRGGGGERAGNPREFGIVKFSQGRDFDIKNGLLGEKFKWRYGKFDIH